MAGQSPNFNPADKQIYALRDVTETVANVSLITASILSKKMDEDLDCLVLDMGLFVSVLKQFLYNFSHLNILFKIAII